MNIVESYLDKPLRTDPKSAADLYEFMVYDIPQAVRLHVEQLLLPGKTVALFSGSWRLDLDATYLELKMFQHSLLDFHKSTVFVDHNNHQLFDYVLDKLTPTNFLILHNDWWTGHAPIDKLLVKLDQFLKYVRPQQGQVICTLPLIHLNFNKLTMDYNDLLRQTNGIIVDDSLVVVIK